MGAFREVLGAGTFLDFPLFGENFEPWVVMVLPPGGFLTLGFLLLALNHYQERQKKKAQPEGDVA